MPQTAGEVTLPAIEVTWWDTTTDQQRTARLEGKTLSVLPTAGAPPAVSEVSAAAGSTDAAVSSAASHNELARNDFFNCIQYGSFPNTATGKPGR